MTGHESDAAPSPDLQDVLGQLPSGAQINVHRWAETGGPKPGYRYLGRIDAADYSPELIARRWGGGHYRLYVRVPPDEARKAGVPQLLVRELAIDPAAAPGPPPGAAPAPAPAADVPQGVAQLISLQTEMLRAAIAAMRPPESTAETIRTVAELMRGQAQQDPLRDLMLELVRSQVGGGRPQWAELWEVFQRGMEAAREWRATGDSSALERLGMRFAELLERAQSSAGPSATAVPQRPAAPPLAPVPASALSSGTMAQLPAWRRWLDRLRPLVFEAARLSGPPEVYAQLLVEHLPPECDAEVGAMLAGDDWPDNLLAQLPADWAPVVGWLRSVLVAFGRQFEEEPEEPEPEPPPGGAEHA